MSDLAKLLLLDARRAQSSNASSVLLSPGDPLPSQVLADLRTDHAGEIGAVYIYQGVLRFARDPLLRAFAQHHLATEQKHLGLVTAWLPAEHHSRLLPVWRLAGFLTGALPALFGPRAVYATIEAVETFVDNHYNEQVQMLALQPTLGKLLHTLQLCQADEVAHRKEAAAARGPETLNIVLRAWCAMVGAGSRVSVALIRYI